MQDDEVTEPSIENDFEIRQYDHTRGSTYVRRIAVEGGWLYQTLDGSIQLEVWSHPVFVPRPAAPNPIDLMGTILRGSS